MSTTIQATSALHALQTASSSDLRAKVSQAGTVSAGADVRAATQGPTAREIASDVSAYYYAREHSDEVTYTRAGLVPTERSRVLTAIQEKYTAAIEGMKKEYGRFLEGLQAKAPDLSASYMKSGPGFVRFGFSLDTNGDLVARGYDLTGRESDKNRLTQLLNQDTALKDQVLAFYNAAREFQAAAGWAEGNRMTPESFQQHDIGEALQSALLLSGSVRGSALNLSFDININNH